MDNTTIIGASGTLIMLIGFLLNQKNIWKNSDIRYDAANLVGSVLLINYAILLHSLPFAVLNFVWAAASFKDVMKSFKKSAMDQNEKYLKFIKPIAWDEVFNLWEENEAKQEYWIAHYKKRGFNSWKEWRADTIKAIDSRNKTWELHEIVNPMEYVPRFFGGPFRSWIKNVYQGKKTLSFSEIANNPQIQKNIAASKIIENFPSDNFFIGLKTIDGIVVIEGMHRCCAIALAAKKKKTLNIRANIAISVFPDKNIPLFGSLNSPT